MGVSLTSSRSFYEECHAISLKTPMEMPLTLPRSFCGNVIREMPSTSLETSIIFHIHKDLPFRRSIMGGTSKSSRGCHSCSYGHATHFPKELL